MLHILPLDIKGCGQRKTQSFALTDGIADKSLVASENIAVLVDKIRIRAVLHKADVLTVVLFCINKAVIPGKRTHLFLTFKSTEGKIGVGKLLLIKKIKHIRLIFIKVFGL